jgi:hypothetical protein
VTLSTAFTAEDPVFAVVGEFFGVLMMSLVKLMISFFGMASAGAATGRDNEGLAPIDPPYASEVPNLHPAHRARA